MRSISTYTSAEIPSIANCRLRAFRTILVVSNRPDFADDSIAVRSIPTEGGRSLQAIVHLS